MDLPDGGAVVRANRIEERLKQWGRRLHDALFSQTDLVSADRLGNLLAQHQIPLVVLEACRSATLGKTAIFRSVAPPADPGRRRQRAVHEPCGTCGGGQDPARPLLP
ncbi:MAG: hypothetical protein LJE70_10885 [Chromatiaceae bacterium]|nr:hypothetical protein [Chromatiaceae bacterium]